MVAGAIIDSKYGDNFYFSHRSFQEFLMAEYLLLEKIPWESLGSESISFGAEVVDFVKECDDPEILSRLFGDIETQVLVYWDRTLDIAVALYEKLHSHKLSDAKSSDALKTKALSSWVIKSPFRIYLHAELLVRRAQLNGREKSNLSDLIEYMRNHIFEQPFFFYAAGKILVECATRKIFPRENLLGELVHLILAQWEFKTALRYFEGKQFYKKSKATSEVEHRREETWAPRLN